MIERADIVIIGAGSSGTSIAYHLARYHAGKIVVIEKSGVGSGATGQAAGLIRHHYSDRALVDMALYSSKKLEHFQEEMGYGIDYVKNGFCYFEKQNEKELEHTIKMQKEAGVRLEILDQNQIRTLHPRGEINPEGIGTAFYDPDGAYADPYKLAVGYANKAKELGVIFEGGVQVEKVLVEKKKAIGVQTNKGTIYCDRVVNAAGLGAAAFLAQEEAKIDLIYMPLGHMVVIPDRPYEKDIITICDASVPEDMFFIRPESGGTVLLGSDIDESGEITNPNTYYQRVSYERMTKYFENLTFRMPFVKEYGYQTAFGALDVRTADWNPGIGSITDGIENLYHVVGGSGHCFKLAPAIGEWAARDLMGEPKPFDAAIFDINRLVGMEDNKGTFFITEG